jgi:prevent-host-death family protein
MILHACILWARMRALEAIVEQIGVRELKERTSEIVRRVREDQAMYEITHRGRAVARLVPITESDVESRPETFWAEFDRLAAEIGARWPEELTAEEAVREQRRA